MIGMDDNLALQLKRLLQQVVIVAFEFPYLAPIRFAEPAIVLFIDVIFEWLKSSHPEPEPEEEKKPEEEELQLGHASFFKP
jgi:hypothetical protein